MFDDVLLDVIPTGVQPKENRETVSGLEVALGGLEITCQMGIDCRNQAVSRCEYSRDGLLDAMSHNSLLTIRDVRNLHRFIHHTPVALPQ
ncbi:hypothetical protein [Paracoccus sanguinis]|uniref:hypothetical protein n=1 Tax=Paracoccus sanguinis TaxID=1545044 RepID=UPI001E50EC4F|nr:hypothetical protein [Paracoccus sanguinis]